MSAPRVLVTRPQPEADRWAAKLTARGYAPAVASVMAIEPVSAADQVQRVKNVILDFDHYQKAVFVSRNAVREAGAWLDAYWPQLPVGIDYFAVGRATADELARLDIPVRALGREDGAMNSEALLADPALQTVEGEKIVIFRGRGGRDLLKTELEARGARVSYCELYHRVVPASAERQLAQALSEPCRAVAVHSGESLTSLTRLARTQGLWPTLAEAALIVPGERVSTLARELGYGRIYRARNASDEAMMAALEAAVARS